jgi:hypothetical protein
VVAQTCEVVAPNGQYLLPIDVTVAKAALAARFPK